MEEGREGTWYSSIIKTINKYKINKKVTNVLKSEWKEVKGKIRMAVEEDVKIQCNTMKKTRTIRNDKYEMKEYLKKTSPTEASEILRMRLHMARLPCNYTSSKDV